MVTPRERFDQALKTSIRNPYDDLLSFSIDPNGVTLLQLHADLLRDENMFENLLETLRNDLPTRSLQVSLQDDSDYDVQDLFTTLRESLLDVEEMQVTRVPYQENESSWKGYLWKAGLVGAGAIATPFLVTAGIGALGFTAAGVTAGSAAAGIMSTYGGTVAAGSMCAALQSIGAAGLGAAGTTIASTVGAAVGGIGVKLFSSGSNGDNHKNDNDEGETTDEL